MTLRIAVSGPTGSGKTTLARTLQGLSRAVVMVPEPEPAELFDRFREAPEQWCYELQQTIIEGRERAAPEVRRAEIAVFDRTPSEDLHVFVQLHHRNGYLSHTQLKSLTALAENAESSLGCPDVCVYLHAPADTLRQRLAMQNPPPVILESLDQQVELYSDWMYRRACPVATVHTGHISLSQVPLMARWVLLTAGMASRGEDVREPQLGLTWRTARA